MVLDEDLEPVPRGPVEGQHEEVQVHGQPVHDGHLVPVLGPDQLGRGGLAGLVAHRGAQLALEVHEHAPEMIQVESLSYILEYTIVSLQSYTIYKQQKTVEKKAIL